MSNLNQVIVKKYLIHLLGPKSIISIIENKVFLRVGPASTESFHCLSLVAKSVSSLHQLLFLKDNCTGHIS